MQVRQVRREASPAAQGKVQFIEGVSLIPFAVHRDWRGSLVALDRDQGLPFDLKRIFYVFDVPGQQERAGHAISSEMVLVAINGSVAIECSNGRQSAAYRLDCRELGLHVLPGVLVRTRSFSPSAILLVCASKLFGDTEYQDDPFFDRFVGTSKP